MASSHSRGAVANKPRHGSRPSAPGWPRRPRVERTRRQSEGRSLHYKPTNPPICPSACEASARDEKHLPPVIPWPLGGSLRPADSSSPAAGLLAPKRPIAVGGWLDPTFVCRPICTSEPRPFGQSHACTILRTADTIHMTTILPLASVAVISIRPASVTRSLPSSMIFKPGSSATRETYRRQGAFLREDTADCL
jgi:hypothetical protein